MRFCSPVCLIVLLLLPFACTGNDVDQRLIRNAKIEGEKTKMKPYPLGRFSIELPAEMEQAARSHRIRLAQVKEIHWPANKDHDEIRARLWNDKVNGIKKLRPPEGKRDPIIEQRQFKELGIWAKGIFYIGNYALESEGRWELLIDFGPSAVWLETDSLLVEKDNVDKMIRNINTIAKAYTPRKIDDFKQLRPGDWFHLESGALNLPYKWEEQTYARFEGHPLDLKLELEMTETHTDEPEDEGLLARTAAIMATGYATGVDIERIRARKRKVAGLEGEEEVDRMADKYRTAFSFMWRYAGKKDSGEHPEIVLEMESPEGNLDEKLRIWDAILDSMKPLYKQP